MKDNQQQFFDDLQREDDLGLLLRGHLHAEHQLIEFVSLFLPHASRCDWSRLSYRAKVELAYGCGLPSDLKELLERLGTMRNDFAHTLSASLSKPSVLALYNALSKRLREGVKRTYLGMGLGSWRNPSALSPRDLMVLVLINVRSAIGAAIVTIKAKA